MTIRRGEEPTPEHVGDKPSSDDERRDQLNSLAEEIVSTWGKTFRTVFVVVVILGVIIFGLWLLKVDLRVGPVEITRR